MTLEGLLQSLRECPLVASVQASEGSPAEDPATLARLAQASAGEGVRLLRLQGIENIRAVRAATGLPSIGLIKRRVDGFEVYITPALAEVDALLETGVDVIALDATAAPRPTGVRLASLVERIHSGGALAMGDCDTLDSMWHAMEAGCDFVGTTLAGYTAASPPEEGPALELVRDAAARGIPVMAEGRFGEPWQAAAALRAGAIGVVVGGALNDPVKQTRAFLRACRCEEGPVGAIDLGGTWLRFGVFDDSWRLLASERIGTPATRVERLAWIRARLRESGVRAAGVGAGGIVDPATGEVWRSKPLIPDHEGTVFAFDVPTLALNDGLATAWGHACHPLFAGGRVATIALGTGVGFGVVDRGRLLMGARGEPPHLNDVPTPMGSFESLLGGYALGSEPSPEQIASAHLAAVAAIHLVRGLFHPDHLVVCGSVGLALSGASPASEGRTLDALPSPFGEDAGLYGAAALALWGSGPGGPCALA